MRLKKKIQLVFLASLAVAFVVMALLTMRFYEMRMNGFYEFYDAQTHHIGESIEIMVESVKFDVLNLSQNPVVRTKKDSDFTVFLNADEADFVYDYGPEEKKIIKLFDLYRRSHPHINSVYMGRESGSFVRSHKRARPSKYDPRQRPWYKLALEDKNSVMVTEQYPSVTTDDINIGVVKALVDGSGNIYGVVGADITLERLSAFVSGVRLFKGSHIMLIDEKGVILVCDDKDKQYKEYETAGLKGMAEMMTKEKGRVKVEYEKEKAVVFYNTTEQFRWKVCAVVPEKILSEEKNMWIMIFAAGVFSYLLFGFVWMRIMSKRIADPFSSLLEEMKDLETTIRSKKKARKIYVAEEGELKEFADSFNKMAENLGFAYSQLEENFEELKETDRMKTSFISMISHELKTPLAIIENAYHFLVEKPVDDPQKAEVISGVMKANMERMRMTISDLIDISLIHSGRMNLEIKDVDVCGSIQKIIRHNTILYGKNAERIKIDKPAREDFVVQGDEFRLRQLFSKVIGNALKFSPGDTLVHIVLKKIRGDKVNILREKSADVDPGKEYVLVRIKNEGYGFEEKEKKAMFDVFYQSEDAATRKYGGMGVGLHIAREIAEAHEGIIYAESEGRGKGAEVFIILPFEQ